MTLAIGTQSTEPTGFALVHGGFHGGWCWDALRPHLAGPSVAIDLPGRSGDGYDHAAVRYEDWVKSATQQSLALGGPIILVGHSMAGLSIPQVAIRLGDRLRAIVFVAAVIPPEGKSFAAAYSAPIEPPTWPVPPPEVAAGFFGTEMDKATLAMLLSRLTPEPAGPAMSAISRRGAPEVPAVYVIADGDATGLGAPEAERLLPDFPKLRIVHAPGGHNLMMTRPRELAAILNGLLPAA